MSDKLIVAVSSSALFNMTESDQVFRSKGPEEYRRYQEHNVNSPLERGLAFSIIRRLLNINDTYNADLVEVIILSRNSVETGLRVMQSVQHYGLDISRAHFSSGFPIFNYCPVFNVSLFISGNEQDVEDALAAGVPTGRIMAGDFLEDNENDNELRIAFDADEMYITTQPEAQPVTSSMYTHTQQQQPTEVYEQYNLTEETESEVVGIETEVAIENEVVEVKDYHYQTSSEHPLDEFLRKLSAIQNIEKEQKAHTQHEKGNINISVVSSYNNPTVVDSLKAIGIVPDRAFFISRDEKSSILDVLNPHILFNTQIGPLAKISKTSTIHIPFLRN